MAKKESNKGDVKHIKIASDAPQEEFKSIGERVQRNELKWSYSACDGSKNYHYYRVIKK